MMLHINFIRSPTCRRWMLFSCSPFSRLFLSLAQNESKDRRPREGQEASLIFIYTTILDRSLNFREHLPTGDFSSGGGGWNSGYSGSTVTWLNILYRSRNKARKRGRVNGCEYAFDLREPLGRACKSRMNLGFWGNYPPTPPLSQHQHLLLI